MNFKHPLMRNNISSKDLKKVITFLKTKNPILTQSKNVSLFEEEWSKWLGVKYSVFVNSGSSANLLSMTILKEKFNNGGEILVPALTWISDISSVIQTGFKPVFVDINKKNLCMDEDQIYKKVNKNTRAVFLTHAQGFNGITNKILKFLKFKSIILIEDVCESHGATFKNKKLGTYGLMSNFSFYYAHHMSTIEGGIISTNNYKIYQKLRIIRSHGMVRESNNDKLKSKYIKKFNDLHKDFIFAYAAYNFRNTEINAIIGRNQLKTLDKKIKKRNANHKFFLNNIDKKKYYTEFDLVGSSNYAFNLILLKPNKSLARNLMNKLNEAQIEFRRGSAGGGNQLRQPYLKNIVKKDEYKNVPITDHIHFYGFYIGNYPSLTKRKILQICKIINTVN